MSNWRRVLLAVGAWATLVILAAPPAGATRIRPGTISLGGMLEYGWLAGNSFMAGAFDKGFGGGLTVRYRMRNGWVVGATFTEQTYNVVAQSRLSASADSLDLDHTSVITAGLEIGRYFGPHQSPYYFLLGAGVWSPTAYTTPSSTATDSNGNPLDETFAANKSDLLYVSATAGTEIFFRRTVALDFSVRGLLHGGDKNGYPHLDTGISNPASDHEIQVHAGLQFYVMD